MEKEQKLKKFHITITKNQAKAISKLGDLEFSLCKPLNIKILHFKPYKDSESARVTFGYYKVRDLAYFMYLVGLQEGFNIVYDK